MAEVLIRAAMNDYLVVGVHVAEARPTING